MATRGRVREWHDDEGWGVVDAEEAPGGCWAHFSAVRVDGFKSLASGTEVLLELEPADQDGYDFRALTVWRADEQPVDGETSTDGPSPVYRTELRLTYDEPGLPD